MMSEVNVREKLAEIQSEEGEKAPEEQTPEFESVEEEAKSLGWREDGKNKFGQTVSAERFIQEKPLYDTIGKLKNTLHTLDEKVETLQTDQKTMAQNFIKEKEGLLSQLKAQKEQALTDLDTDKVRAIDTQIDEIQATKMPEAQATRPYSKAEYEKSWIKFVAKNDWYDDKPGMRSSANIIGDEYKATHPNHTPDELFAHVESEIRKEFPSRFEEKQTPSKVSSTTRRGSSGGKTKTVKLSDLPADEQRIVRVMAAGCGKDANDCEEYLKTYKLED